MDISCNICGGKGCPFCKGTGWVEILGCGMVDPNVLEANGIDSKVYSGYALGMGIERITNLKYRVNDLRLFSENDTRFLKRVRSCQLISLCFEFHKTINRRNILLSVNRFFI